MCVKVSYRGSPHPRAVYKPSFPSLFSSPQHTATDSLNPITECPPILSTTAVPIYPSVHQDNITTSPPPEMSQFESKMGNIYHQRYQASTKRGAGIVEPRQDSRASKASKSKLESKFIFIDRLPINSEPSAIYGWLFSSDEKVVDILAPTSGCGCCWVEYETP